MGYLVEITDTESGKMMSMSVDSLTDLTDPSALAKAQRTASVKTNFQWFISMFEQNLKRMKGAL